MPVPYNKVRISGTMPGGEVWSVNPCFGRQDGSAVDTFEELDEWADAIAADNSGAVVGTRLRELMSSALQITSIRTEYYGPDGLLADAAETSVGAGGIGTGTPTKPFQTAVALSLRTARPGRSYRGRLYWPAIGAGMNAATLRLIDSNAQAIATEAAQLLRQIAAAGQGAAVLQPVVVSQTMGINSPIIRVEVGNIMDVQRRRRDALEEQYFQAPLVPA